MEATVALSPHHAQSSVPFRRISPYLFPPDISDRADADTLGHRVVLHGFFCDQRSHARNDRGAVWVYLHRTRLESAPLPITLSNFALATALAMPASVMVQFCLITATSVSLTTVVEWSLLLVAMGMPYVFSGVVVSSCVDAQSVFHRPGLRRGPDGRCSRMYGGRLHLKCPRRTDHSDCDRCRMRSVGYGFRLQCQCRRPTGSEIACLVAQARTHHARFGNIRFPQFTRAHRGTPRFGQEQP